MMAVLFFHFPPAVIDKILVSQLNLNHTFLLNGQTPYPCEVYSAIL